MQTATKKLKIIENDRPGRERPRLVIHRDTDYTAYFIAQYRMVQGLWTTTAAKRILYPGKRPHGLLLVGRKDRIDFAPAHDPAAEPFASIEF